MRSGLWASGRPQAEHPRVGNAGDRPLWSCGKHATAGRVRRFVGLTGRSARLNALPGRTRCPVRRDARAGDWSTRARPSRAWCTVWAIRAGDQVAKSCTVHDSANRMAANGGREPSRGSESQRTELFRDSGTGRAFGPVCYGFVGYQLPARPHRFTVRSSRSGIAQSRLIDTTYRGGRVDLRLPWVG